MSFLPQASVPAQSELTTHLGLQPAKGSPKYSGRQVHWQLLVPRTEASALGPQGFGLQGSLGRGGGGAGDDRDLTSLLVLGVSLCREMEYTFMGFEGTFSSVTRCSAKAYKPVCF